MISTRRAWLTCCVFPSSVDQSNRTQQGILQGSTFAGADFVTRQLDEEGIVSALRRLFARGLAQ